MSMNPPSPPRPTRRELLLGATAAGLALARPLPSFAAPAAMTDAAFLRLSRTVTGHTDLNPVTAGRMLAALSAQSADFVGQAQSLAGLLTEGMTPEALQAAARTAGLDATMKAILTGWYTGTIGHGQSAVMLAYAEALMYRPAADGLVIPTYCSDGPAWWVAPPPPAGVEPPPAEMPKAR